LEADAVARRMAHEEVARLTAKAAAV
jgi:hypothetical protein